MDISVITWNVLADCYVHGQSSAAAEPELMKWTNRFAHICQIINETHTDIYCMQEVDHYPDSFEPFFHSIGYRCVYVGRPRKADGCLIAYRDDLFNLRDSSEILLDDLGYLDPTAETRNRFVRQNVAAMATFETKISKKPFMIVTCHIHWNPNVPDVKLAQTKYILQRIEAYRAEQSLKMPVLFAGDFNSLPATDIYKLIDCTHHVEADISSYHAFKKNIPGDPGYIYGPDTKFLCDASLTRLCKWLRVLGVDVAMDTWTSDHSSKKKGSAIRETINAYFERATKERRVILTTSRMLRERAQCPASHFVKTTSSWEIALVDIFKDWGLSLNKEKFLTVCGKCGGPIEEVDFLDTRLMGKIMPCDRPVFSCVQCAQPYWWNEDVNSSPAQAMKKADELYTIIKNGLEEDERLRAANLPSARTRGSSSSTSSAVSKSVSSGAGEIAVVGAVSGNGTTTSGPSAQEDNSLLVRNLAHLFALREKKVREKNIAQQELTAAESEAERLETLASYPNALTMVAKAAAAATPNPVPRAASSSAAAAVATSGALKNPYSDPKSPSLTVKATALVATEAIATLPTVEPEQQRKEVSPFAVSFRSVFTAQEDEKRENGGGGGSSSSSSSGSFSPSAAIKSYEPEYTNWSGDFKGTLDYIFVSDEWRVKLARVVPLQGACIASESEILNALSPEEYEERIWSSEATSPAVGALLAAEMKLLSTLESSGSSSSSSSSSNSGSGDGDGDGVVEQEVKETITSTRSTRLYSDEVPMLLSHSSTATKQSKTTYAEWRNGHVTSSSSSSSSLSSMMTATSATAGDEPPMSHTAVGSSLNALRCENVFQRGFSALPGIETLNDEIDMSIAARETAIKSGGSGGSAAAPAGSYDNSSFVSNKSAPLAAGFPPIPPTIDEEEEPCSSPLASTSESITLRIPSGTSDRGDMLPELARRTQALKEKCLLEGPQPSKYWPSDHFAILSLLSLK